MTPIDPGTESYRKLHPFAKMPVPEHGQVRLYETLRIVSSADFIAPPPGLTPPDPQTRAEMLMLVSALNACGYEALVMGTINALQQGMWRR